MKYNYLFFAFSFLLIFMACQNNLQFDNVEDLTKYFISNLKSGNLNKINKLYSYYDDEHYNKINMEKFLKWLNVNDYSRDMFQISFNYYLYYMICGFFNNDFEILLKTNTPEYSYDQMEQFINQCDFKKLKSLKFIRMDKQVPDEILNKLIKEKRERMGYDENNEYSILFSFDYNYYIGSITFIRYGKYWYIDDFMTIHFPFSGVKKLSNINEYESYIK